MTTTAHASSTEELAELRRLADDVFGASVEPVLDEQCRGLPFDAGLWSTLAESGLTLLTTPEAAGGSGAGLRELAVVLERSGYHAAPVPLAENDLLASWLLRTADLPVGSGAMTSALTTAELDGEDRLTTTLSAVPWARDVDRLVVAGPGYVAALTPAEVAIADRDDVAGQPYGQVTVDTRPGALARVDGPDVAGEFRLRGALARSLQTCGALTRALELSSAHVTERVQFGRPLSKFQAVQTLIASAASAVCLATSACDFAVDTVERHGFDSAAADFAISVAKVESCRAATVAARNTHQSHGAIGFTLDHRLRHFSMRALAWRSEFGSAREWQDRLGRMVLDSGSSAWEFVTAASSSG